MPHDRDGARLKVGDRVLVPCWIKAIHDTEQYCNVDLETLGEMYPSRDRTLLTLNAKQVVLVTPVPLAEPLAHPFPASGGEEKA